MAIKSTEGSRRANYPILTRGGSDKHSFSLSSMNPPMVIFLSVLWSLMSEFFVCPLIFDYLGIHGLWQVDDLLSLLEPSWVLVSVRCIVILVWIDLSGRTFFDLMEDSSRISSSLSFVGL